jgi:hypothetical protein
MSAVPDSEPSLSRAEVEALLGTFSPADWQRAKSIATSFCGGLTGWTPLDLLQETVTKFLEGVRTWPAGVHPLIVLKMAKHNKVSPVDEDVVLDPFEVESDGETALVAHGKVVVTPEDETSGKQQIAAVYAAVAGDEDLELLVLAWADGLRGDSAMQELGWDNKKYDAARKRLMRRLDAVAPRRTK